MLEKTAPAARWQITLPFELQHAIFRIATEFDGPSDVDKATSGILRLLNSEINRLIEPLMFCSITIRTKRHLADFVKRMFQDNNAFMLHIRRIITVPDVFHCHKNPILSFISMIVEENRAASLRLPIPEIVIDFGFLPIIDLDQLRGLCHMAVGLQCHTIRIVNHDAHRRSTYVSLSSG